MIMARSWSSLITINGTKRVTCAINVSRRALSSVDDLVTVSTSGDGFVKALSLNNPKKRNCLSLEMMSRLNDQLIDAQQLRLIIIRAEGKVFSSGHDLKELRQNPQEFQKKVFDLSAEIVLKIRNFPTPVISVVCDQIVAASGTQLVASTDMILCTKSSTFSTPGSSVGLFCSTPGISLSRKANKSLSEYMLLTGLPVDGQEALQGGLVTKCYDDVDKLEEGLKTITESILNKSKPVISLGKEFFHRQLDMSIENAYKEGANVMVKNMSHEDAEHGIDCFTSKTKATWSHSKFKDGD